MTEINYDFETEPDGRVGRAGVDFIKVGPKAQVIEIARSICALQLRPTF